MQEHLEDSLPEDDEQPEVAEDEKFIDKLSSPTPEELFEKGLFHHDTRLTMSKDKATLAGEFFTEARKLVVKKHGKKKWKWWIEQNYGDRIKYGMVRIYCLLYKHRDVEGVKEAGSITEAKEFFPKKHVLRPNDKRKTKSGRRRKASGAKALPQPVPAAARETGEEGGLSADEWNQLGNRLGLADRKDTKAYCFRFTYEKIVLDGEEPPTFED